MLPNPSTPNHLSTHLLPPLDETPPIEDAWIFAFEERRMSRDSTPSSPSPIRSSSAFPASATPSSSPTRARERSRPADREGDRVNPNPFEQAVIIDDDEQDWMNQEVSIKEVVPASNLPDIPSFVYHSDPFETAEAEVEVDKEAELERSRPVSSFASSSSSPLTRLAPIATPPRKPSTRRGTLVPLLNVDTCTPARDRPYSAPPTNNRLPFRSSSTTSIPNSAAPFSAIPGPLPKELWAKGSSFSTLSKSSAYLGGKAQDAQRWIVRAAAKGVRGIKSATGSSAKVSKTSLGEEDEGTAELKRKQREREREMEKEEWRVLSVGLQERKIRGRSGSRLVKGRRGVRAKREEQMRRKRMCVWLGVVAGVLVFVLVGVVGLIMHLRMEREHQKGNGINPFDNGDSNATGGGGGGGADGGSVVPSPINHTSPTIVPVLTNSTNLNNPPDPKANPSPTSHIPPCPPWKTPERQGLEPPSTREPGPPSRNLGSASVAETSSNPSFDDLHHDMGSRTSKWVLVQQSDGSFVCKSITTADHLSNENPTPTPKPTRAPTPSRGPAPPSPAPAPNRPTPPSSSPPPPRFAPNPSPSPSHTPPTPSPPKEMTSHLPSHPIGQSSFFETAIVKKLPWTKGCASGSESVSSSLAETNKWSVSRGKSRPVKMSETGPTAVHASEPVPKMDKPNVPPHRPSALTWPNSTSTSRSSPFDLDESTLDVDKDRKSTSGEGKGLLDSH